MLTGTDLLADRGETTSLAVLVDRLGDPVDPGVATDLHDCQHYKDKVQK